MMYLLPYVQKRLRLLWGYLVRSKRHIASRLSHEPYRLAVWLILLCTAIIALHLTDRTFSFGLRLDEQGAIVEIFSVTIGALAAILGIVIAFLISTFEMNKRYLSSNYAENLFKNDTLRGLVVLYVGTIAIALGGLIAVNLENVPLVTILVLATSYLFVVCIFALIPRMRQLVAETNTSKEIAKIAEAMVSRVRTGYFSIGTSQLSLLMEIGKKASSEGEESIVVELIDVLNDKFEEISKYLDTEGTGIIYGAQPRDMAGAFTAIFYVLGKATLSNHQYNITEYAAKSILRLMGVYAEKQQMYHTLIEAEKYFIKLAKAVIADGNEELGDSLVYGLRNYIETQLENNTPPAEELWMFEAFDEKKRDEKDIKYDLSNHWHHISVNYFYRYRDLVQYAIRHNNSDALQTLLSTLNSLSNNIMKLENLTDEHKARTLGPLGAILEGCYREAIDNNLITRDSSFMLFMLDPFFNTDEIVRTEKNYSVWNLQRVCNIFVYAAEKGVLSPETLNNIGSSGRSLKKHIKESRMAAQSVIYIVTILGMIRDAVAGQVGEDLWSSRIYTACYEQATSIQKWDKKVKVRSVTIKLNKSLAKYVLLEKAKAHTKEKDRDVWGELFGDK